MNVRTRVLFLALVMVVVAAACASDEPSGTDDGGTETTASDEPAGDGEPVNLTMWWWGEQEAAGAEEWLNETIAAYEAENPNITIDAVLQTTDGLIPNFLAAAEAEEGPDIQFFWAGSYMLEHAWSGAVAPLSDYLSDDELSHYLGGEVYQYDGKTWAAPWYSVGYPMFYRTDVLESAGVAPPETWDELLAACDTLNAAGVTPLAGGLKDGFFGGWLFAVIGGQGITDIGDFMDAASTGSASLGEGEYAEWWTRLQELRDHDCWNEDINSLDLYQGHQQIIDGDAAMTVASGSDIQRFVDEGGAENIAIAPMPAWSDGPFAGKLASTAQSLGVTAWSPHKQEAADFIAYMHSDAPRQRWFEITGSFPADDRFDSSVVELPQLLAFFSLLSDGGPWMEDYVPVEIDIDAHYGFPPLVLSGDMSAQDAAQQTEDIAVRVRGSSPELMGYYDLWAESF